MDDPPRTRTSDAPTTIPDTFPNLKRSAVSPANFTSCSSSSAWGSYRDDVRQAVREAIGVPPLTYRTHAGDIITLPAGMTTDLASIPRLLWSFLPPDGPWVQIAVFHDLLYKTRGTGVFVFKRPDGTPGRLQASRSRAAPYTRQEADELLRDGMVTSTFPAGGVGRSTTGCAVGGAGRTG